MKVKIVATYTWDEEVTDDDLTDICEQEYMKPDEDGKFDEDQLDKAFQMWKEDQEEAIVGDSSNISDDAVLDVEFIQ